MATNNSRLSNFLGKRCSFLRARSFGLTIRREGGGYTDFSKENPDTKYQDSK
jgi:hypothetical protein